MPLRYLNDILQYNVLNNIFVYVTAPTSSTRSVAGAAADHRYACTGRLTRVCAPDHCHSATRRQARVWIYVKTSCRLSARVVTGKHKSYRDIK